MEKYGFREDFDWETRFDLKTQVGNYTVSTVDLGINHQFDDDLPPLYYETMIFSDSEKNPFVYYQERYTTEIEARKGHKKAIRFVKKLLKEEKKWKKNLLKLKEKMGLFIKEKRKKKNTIQN